MSSIIEGRVLGVIEFAGHTPATNTMEIGLCDAAGRHWRITTVATPSIRGAKTGSHIRLRVSPNAHISCRVVGHVEVLGEEPVRATTPTTP